MLSRRNLADASRRSSLNPRLFNSLQPLYGLFPTPLLCFQQLAASFPKSPGWGVSKHVSLPTHQPALSSLRQLSALCACPSGRWVSALSFAVAFVRSSRRFLCPPLSTFRINTCKSVSKQRTLTTFRMNTYAKQGEGGPYSEGPSGRKYCVPLTGSCRRRSNCCRSALRSTKSISEVLITRRSEAA